MKPSEHRIVNVFGNEIEPQDNLVVSLLPQLRHQLPTVTFVVADPTEELVPIGERWIILDVGVGIDRVVMVERLDQLDFVQGQSVHDFDVYMDLRLKQKLGTLPPVKLVIVPTTMPASVARKEIVRVLTELFQLVGNNH